MMRILLITLLSFVAFACHKSDAGPKDDMIGNWSLTEVLMDPGDGSGTWESPQLPATLNLSADGRVSGSTYMFSGYDRYSIENDSVVVFGSTSSTSSLSVRYKLFNNRLELYPPCFEPCGFKFNYSGK